VTCFGVDSFSKCSNGKRTARPLTVVVDEVTCRRCVQLLIREYLDAISDLVALDKRLERMEAAS
jgi:hypothetical protein